MRRGPQRSASSRPTDGGERFPLGSLRAGDQESSAGQAGSKPTSASRDVHAGVIFSSSAILDLSQSGLHHFEEIFKVPNLRVSGQPLGLVHAGRVDVNEGFAHLQVSF